MTAIRSVRYLVLHLLTSLIAMQGIAAAATPIKIRVTLVEQREYDGTIGYRLYGNGGVFFSRSEVLTTPAGMQIPEFDAIRFSSWSELVAASVGEWRFSSTSKTDPLDSEEYRFIVSAPDYPDMATLQFPVVSPPSGSVVTSPLTISWNPPTNSYSDGASNVASFKPTLLESGKLEVVFGRSYSNNARLRFATAQQQDLSAFVSEAVPPAGDPLYDATPVLTFRRETAVQYIPSDAVPEPSSALLLTAVGPAFLSLSRRYRPVTSPLTSLRASTEAID